MPLLWCSVSGHGFGHAAQVAPILNALGPLVPGLRVIVRTTVPAAFFASRLAVPWEYRPAVQDIGCVQDGPLKIDVPGTWAALERFHANWDTRVDEEAQVLTAARPDLVLSDISYLALAAATRAGIPNLAIGSLAWDEIMQPYLEPQNHTHLAIANQMRSCYGTTTGVIRLEPSLPLPSFKKAIDVGPIVEPLAAEPTRLRNAIGARDRECLVLVGFGGISLTSLPYDRMEQMVGYQFLVDGHIPPTSPRIHALKDVDMRFMSVLASADLVMSKPGYGTIVEAVDKRKPIVYVRRYNFADEQRLVDYLHRHGQGAELSLEDFTRGKWEHALTKALTPPAAPPLPPPKAGVLEAAKHCAALLTGT